MIYLTRPVYLFEVDWSDAPSRRFSFDLRELQIGFGAEFFNSLQQHVVNGYELTTFLENADAIIANEAFFDALLGRLQGFWLPTPFQSMIIAASVSGTQFDIEDIGLTDTLALHPDIYLFFEREIVTGHTASTVRAAAKILNVVDLGNGRERVTLDAVLNTDLFNTESRVCRLQYVRLAGDEEQGSFFGEGISQRTDRFVELPHEYAAFETGERPIYLYHFWCASPMDFHWRYTSFAANVISQNATFSKFPINHGALKRTTKADETLSINAKHDANHPFALFHPYPFSRPLNVEVIEVSYAAPDTQRKLFTGQVRNVEDGGDKLVARCDSWAAILKKKSPLMMIQKDCNYSVYDERTCKARMVLFDAVAQISDLDDLVSPATVTIALNDGGVNFDKWITEDWFAAGFLQTGQGANFEVRTILNSEFAGDNLVLLTINAPLVHAIVGQSIHVIAGCDGKKQTCKTKFNNFDNFGGFVQIPDQNLSLKALDAPVSQGDKK